MAKASRAKKVSPGRREKISIAKKQKASVARTSQTDCERASASREPLYVQVENWVIDYLDCSYTDVKPDMLTGKDLAMKSQDFSLLGQAFAQAISKPPFDQFVNPKNFRLNPGQLQRAASGDGKKVSDIICCLYRAAKAAPKAAPRKTAPRKPAPTVKSVA